MEKIRVLILDENAIFREGLAAALSREEGIEVVGHTGSAEEGLTLQKAMMPGVVILDVDLPRAGGLRLATRLRRCCPVTAIITLTPREDDEELYQAIRGGVAAHLSRSLSAPELIEAIRRVAAGEYLVNESLLTRPKLASRLLEQFQDYSVSMGERLESLLVPLSPRERQILEYIAHGNSNKQIAHVVGLKEQSVKNYVTSILRKLAANDRAHAVFIALRHGWIRTG